MTQTEPIAWRSIRYGTPVVSSDGRPLGTVREVLGSDSKDLFHGLRVALPGPGGDVMVSADDIARMSIDEIGTSLTSAEFTALGVYDEAATYHLASVGWLRRHLGWKRDDTSDEEPG